MLAGVDRGGGRPAFQDGVGVGWTGSDIFDFRVQGSRVTSNRRTLCLERRVELLTVSRFVFLYDTATSTGVYLGGKMIDINMNLIRVK